MQNLISTTDEKNINSIYLEMDRYWKYKKTMIVSRISIPCANHALSGIVK